MGCAGAVRPPGGNYQQSSGTPGGFEELKGPAIRNFFRFYPVLALLAVLVATGAVLWTAAAPQAGPGNYSGISVEASPQIFATMCALDAAGFEADESTLADMPGRLALRADLLKAQGPTAEALRQFYRDHALSSPAETLSHYITLALVVGPPPRFQFQSERQALPPDVVTLDGFQELLVSFYREAHLDLRWAKVEPEYEPAVQRYQAALGRIVTSSNGYLREILKQSQGRTFTVYVEPLVGARTNFRNYGDHYSIVVGTSGEPLDTIQHAYLHFMLDPLVLRQRQAVNTKSALLDIAARAPQLPVEYRQDFVALVDECLIKAVELRLRRLAPGQLEAALREADASGFVLVRPFAAELVKFEKAEPAMSYYFPDLIVGLDVAAERKRLQRITFAAAAPAAAEQTATESVQPSELDRALAQGERELALQDIPAATATFEQVLAKYPDDARALYGLAIASVLSGKAERARELFEKFVAAPASADSVSNTAWAHVYLGRIHDLKRERELAVNEYRAALAVEGAPEAARAAAQHGADAAYQPPDGSRGNK